MSILVHVSIALVVFMATSAGLLQAEDHRIYIGTYTRGSVSKGIYTCLLNGDTGELSEPVLAAEAANPAFLAIHPTQPLLFCVNEIIDYQGQPQGAVSAYRILDKSGKLELINQQATVGAAPCHLTIDGTGRYVLVANYLGGKTVVFPVGEDGRLQERCCLVQHEGSGPNEERQEASHAHSVNLSADNRYAYVADLGTDRIWIFRFDDATGQLTPTSPAYATVSPGGGPRHFDLAPSGKFAWANNELTSTVTTFRRNVQSGHLEPIHEVSTLPTEYDGRKSTAECRVHPNGQVVYVSNRGHDSIAVYSVASDGNLSLRQIEKTGGKEPRNFFIMPSGKWLLAENQNSDSVVVFSVDEDGLLSQTSHSVTVGRPVCIRMREAE